ncbi:L-fuculokinase [Halosquirtibacter laminarini]|uniref:L-fuculokinase n=1 Tax=Halosquirtibacter laminarini TaxID=3374600 RepID=A0AC61NH68_9BACT|nr:L-fuculokinase [Prolixibacteraceae bacterium]
MTHKDIAIVFDCGATNVRVIAMNRSGQIIAAQSMPNETDEDPYYPGGRVWDIDKLWSKLCKATKTVTAQIDVDQIAGITVTTFGVDGTFIDDKGAPLYPIISWQCARTQPIMDNIGKYMPLEEVYQISGVYPYAFNTINKMIWFKENRPEVIEQADRYLFISSILASKLSGVYQNDATMMGTSMMADIGKRDLSEKILNTLGIDLEKFGSIGEPGDQVGGVTESAALATGLPETTPVFLTGHDTQFAIFGSGAELNQPVLSSGTWEIIMTRSSSFSSSIKELKNNLTTELDSISGVYNIGQNWLGSGVLEWFAKNFYPNLSGDALYEKMIHDAEQEVPGSEGISVDPAFYDDGTSKNSGTIRGLKIDTRKGQVYRAFLESLAYRLREGLEAIEEAGEFKNDCIICVGGGSKNMLWNQLRADVCNTPIHLIDQKETTVLGAAMFVFSGSGVYSTPEAAREKITYNPKVITPSKNINIYNQLYKQFLEFKNKP